MFGIAIYCMQHSQVMLERGVRELAHSFFLFFVIVHIKLLNSFFHCPDTGSIISFVNRIVTNVILIHV